MLFIVAGPSGLPGYPGYPGYPNIVNTGIFCSSFCMISAPPASYSLIFSLKLELIEINIAKGGKIIDDTYITIENSK